MHVLFGVQLNNLDNNANDDCQLIVVCLVFGRLNHIHKLVLYADKQNYYKNTKYALNKILFSAAV